MRDLPLFLHSIGDKEIVMEAPSPLQVLWFE